LRKRFIRNATFSVIAGNPGKFDSSCRRVAAARITGEYWKIYGEISGSSEVALSPVCVRLSAHMETHPLLMLVVGWLLGLVAPLVSDRITEGRQTRKELIPGVRSDLIELQFKLGSLRYCLAIRFGTYNEEFLKWLKPIVDDYNRIYPDEKVFTEIDERLKMTDAQLTALAQALQDDASKAGISLRKYDTAFIESQLDKLGRLDVETHRLILVIRSRLGYLNEMVDEARVYLRLTFENISDANHEQVVNNINGVYRVYGENARDLVDLIRHALQRLRN
jgi:hypothetical protein